MDQDEEMAKALSFSIAKNFSSIMYLALISKYCKTPMVEFLNTFESSLKISVDAYTIMKKKMTFTVLGMKCLKSMSFKTMTG